MINSNFGFTPLKEVWLGDCYPESYYDHLPNKTFFSNILDALLTNANEISKANDILLMIDSDSNRDYLDL